MIEENANGGPGGVSRRRQMFGDLRARNQRRAMVTRTLDAERRQRVERVMQVARQRRFRQAG